MEVKKTERSEVVVMHDSTRGLAPARPERRPYKLLLQKTTHTSYGQLPERKEYKAAPLLPERC